MFRRMKACSFTLKNPEIARRGPSRVRSFKEPERFMQRFFFRWVSVLCLLLPVISVSCHQRETSPFRLIREFEGYREYEFLPNGLRVLLKADDSFPIACLIVTYQVGSRQELDGQRGSAHLIEHMMFRGTPRYHKDHDTAIFSVLQGLGAGLHGATWADGMEFLEILLQEHLGKAMDIEADRMRHALFKPGDLTAEMPVVQSEFDMMENSPAVALQNAVWAEAFQVHPYHFSEIGLREDLNAATSGSLRSFYDQYFWPNNATVTVLGSFDTQTVLRLIESTFGSLPRSPAPIVDPVKPEPDQTQSRRITLTRGDPVEMVMIAHKIPAARDKDQPALDILAQILCGGKLSRLYGLLEEGLVSDVSCEAGKNRDPGLLMTRATLTPEAGHQRVEDRILEVYRRLRSEPPSEAELIRAQNNLLAAYAYRQDGYFSLAMELSYAISFGDWAAYPQYPAKISSVTAEEVRLAAERYLSEPRKTTGWLISKNPLRGESIPEKPAGMQTAESSLQTAGAPIKIPAHLDDEKEPLPARLADRLVTRSVEGIETLALKTRIPGVISLAGSFTGGGTVYAANEMLPLLTADLLDKGTRSHKKLEIAQLLEDRGIQLSFQPTAERLQFEARFLSQDLDTVIRLIAELLREPVFSEEEFNLSRNLQKAAVQQAMGDTEDQTARALSQALYPPAHPYALPRYEDQLLDLDTVTLEDVKSFYASRYGPQEMRLVAVGDVDTRILQKSVADAFHGWVPKPLTANTFPKVAPTPSESPLRIQIPGKVNIDVAAGQRLDLHRKDPDFMAVWLANRVLGGDFLSRLFNRIRDELGLSYHIYSSLNGIEGGLKGHLQIDMIANTATLEPALREMKTVFNGFIENGISDKELIRHRTGAIGNYKVSLASTRNLAREIRRVLEAGMEPAALDRIPEEIAGLTAADVNKAIHKYFYSAGLYIAMAGDFANITLESSEGA